MKLACAYAWIFCCIGLSLVFVVRDQPVIAGLCSGASWLALVWAVLHFLLTPERKKKTMKTILLIAATCAALCFVSPAEAKLFDRLRAPAPLTVTLAPTVEALEVTAPKVRRLRPLERFKARRDLSKQLRKARVPAE